MTKTKRVRGYVVGAYFRCDFNCPDPRTELAAQFLGKGTQTEKYDIHSTRPRIFKSMEEASMNMMWAAMQQGEHTNVRFAISAANRYRERIEVLRHSHINPTI